MFGKEALNMLLVRLAALAKTVHLEELSENLMSVTINTYSVPCTMHNSKIKYIQINVLLNKTVR